MEAQQCWRASWPEDGCRGFDCAELEATRVSTLNREGFAVIKAERRPAQIAGSFSSACIGGKGRCGGVEEGDRKSAKDDAFLSGERVEIEPRACAFSAVCLFTLQSGSAKNGPCQPCRLVGLAVT